MSPSEQKQWKDQVLVELLKGITSDPLLRQSLIFKGARILNRHLDSKRQSLDIDSNLTVDCLDNHPDRIERARWFEENMEWALRRYFDAQEPVCFNVESVRVKNSPSKHPHEFGWNGLIAEVKVQDFRRLGTLGLPVLKVDIASPEALGETARCQLDLDGASITAYSLTRIAGEKLRAFLSSLPAYRSKLSTTDRVVRAKDLYDLARILEAVSPDNERFWHEVSKEFVLACESRFVDCEGLETFLADVDQTEQTYRTDSTLDGVDWTDALESLKKIVSILDKKNLFPLRFSLPSLYGKAE